MKLFGQIFGTNSKEELKSFSVNDSMGKQKNQSQKYNSVDQKTNKEKQDVGTKYLLMPINKVIEINLSNTQVIAKTKNQKSHMVYQIYVKTTDFSYNQKKRFSAFYEFYIEIQQHIKHLNIEFPKKTIMTSGTNVQVVNHRFKLLNLFLERILSQIHQNKNKKLASSFFNFIDLAQQYKKWERLQKKQRIHINQVKEQIYLKQNALQTNLFQNQGSIQIQIKKLNYFQHSSQIIESIQCFIQVRGFRLTNEEIRILLIGIQNYKGLISLALCSQNQIKSIQLLTFLNSILATQKYSFNQRFYKNFQNLSPSVFSLKNKFKVHHSIQFKKLYFRILEIYLSNKLLKIQDVLKEDTQLTQQYNNWKSFFQTRQITNTVSQDYSELNKVLTIQKTKSSVGHCSQTCLSSSEQVNSCKSFQFLPVKNNQDFLKAINADIQKNRSSSKSNMSTSEIALQEQWQKSEMKKQIQQEQVSDLQKEQLIKIEKQDAVLKVYKENEIRIQLLSQLQQKECLLKYKNWNKLIIDQRSDPFTQIQRCVYMLNGKQKIIKFKQKIQENTISHETTIIRKRLAISKSTESLALKSFSFSQPFAFGGAQQRMTFKTLKSCDKYKTKINLNFDFSEEEDYFSSQLKGKTFFLFQYACQAFLKQSHALNIKQLQQEVKQ